MDVRLHRLYFYILFLPFLFLFIFTRVRKRSSLATAIHQHQHRHHRAIFNFDSAKGIQLTSEVIIIIMEKMRRSGSVGVGEERIDGDKSK